MLGLHHPEHGSQHSKKMKIETEDMPPISTSNFFSLNSAGNAGIRNAQAVAEAHHENWEHCQSPSKVQASVLRNFRVRRPGDPFQVGNAMGKSAKQLYEVVLKLRQEEQEIAAAAKRTHKAFEAARRGLHTSLLAHQDACRSGYSLRSC